MSQIEDNLCFDSEGIGLTEPTITLEDVQNLAKRSTTITLINNEEKEKNNTNIVMNCIDLSESEFSESNESKSLKRKKKRIGKRVKRGKNISLQMRLKEYDDSFVVKDNQMYCNLCNDYVKFKNKSVIDAHIKSKKHQKTIESNSKQKKINQSFNQLNEKQVFLNDLVSFMTSNNIALEKVNNKEFRDFFSKYCKFGQNIPTAETIRKQVKNVYDIKQKEIVKTIKKSEGFAVIVDETQDKKCRSVLNILVTPNTRDKDLDNDFKLKSILIDTLFIDGSVDSNAIVRETNKSIINLGLNTDKMTAFVSDNASYMIKAYEVLQVIWPNSVHMTAMSIFSI
jgi:hypothetical protein